MARSRRAVVALLEEVGRRRVAEMFSVKRGPLADTAERVRLCSARLAGVVEQSSLSRGFLRLHS
jgi:hypothetical protein